MRIELEGACIRCLATSPPQLAPSLLSISNDNLKEFSRLNETVSDAHSTYTKILAAWEKLDASTVDFDTSYQRFRESLATYEAPYFDNSTDLKVQIDSLSQALAVLIGTKIVESSNPGLPSEAQTLRNRFLQLNECHTIFISYLEEVNTKEDLSVTLKIAQRSNEMDKISETLQQIISVREKIIQQLNEFISMKESLDEEVSDFSQQAEALILEEKSCTSVSNVSELISRCELCTVEHGKFAETLKTAKDKLSLLAPYTKNPTILELQGALTHNQHRYGSAHQMIRSLIKRLKERINADDKLKTEMVIQTNALSEAEKRLLTLSTSGRLVSNLPFPEALSLSTIPKSELNFAIVKFNNALQEYMSQQKQSVLNHLETILDFQKDLNNLDKVIRDLIGQKGLDDGEFNLIVNDIEHRIGELINQADEVKKEDMACGTFIADINLQITRISEEITSCVDTFMLLEGDSWRISDNPSLNSEPILSKLNELLTRLSEDAPLLSPLKQICLRYPTNDQEWRSYVGLCDLLFNEFSELRHRVEHLERTIREEAHELAHIIYLQRQLSDLHLAFTTRLSEISDYTKKAPTTLEIVSDEKVISLLNAHIIQIKSAKANVQSTISEYTSKITLFLTDLAAAIKSYSLHRKQPVGMLVTRMESQKVSLESVERQGEKLSKELEEESTNWEEFIGQIKGFHHWLLARETDLEAVVTAGSFVECAKYLQNLDKTLRVTGGSMLDKILSCSYALRSIRSDLEVINLTISRLTDRYNSLLETVSERRNELQNTISAEEERQKEVDSCSDLLKRQESELTEICSRPLSVPSVSFIIDTVEERIRKLNEFQRNLEEAKSFHLEPLDKSIQLKNFALDQEKVDRRMANVSELWKRYNCLQERFSTISVELDKLVKTGKDFCTLADGMDSWLNDQKRIFTAMDLDPSISEDQDLHELTDQLANHANNFHRLCVDLNSSGEHRLEECSLVAARMLEIARSINMPLVGDTSSKFHSQQSLTADLQRCFQELLTSTSKQKDETSSLLLSLTAFEELFSSLHTWISSASKLIANETPEDLTKEIELWSTPSSYLTIHTSRILSQLAQSHEKASEIGEKQSQLDVLLARSNQLLEERRSPKVTRLAAKKAGALSRQFVELATLVKKRIEEKSIVLKNIEKLQTARQSYSAWEKDVREQFARACQDGSLDETIKKIRRIIKSLDMGDVLLDACSQWALIVQSDALGTEATNPTLAHDLIASYEVVRRMIPQKLKGFEDQLDEQKTRQSIIDSMSSWLEAAEQRHQAVISSIYTSPQGDLLSASFTSVIALYEGTIARGLSEISALQSECLNKEPIGDDSKLSSRFYALKIRLGQSLSKIEEKSKNLSAYREASELVSIRQKLTLERYVQVTGKNNSNPETVFHIPDPPSVVLELILSAYDAERRLTVLRSLYDELVIDSRHLIETMIELADRLVSNSMEQHDAFLTGIIAKHDEELREEQIQLERVTKQSIELLEGVIETWKVFTKEDDELNDWLVQMEQAFAQSTIGQDMPVNERRRILAERQVCTISSVIVKGVS